MTIKSYQRLFDFLRALACGLVWCFIFASAKSLSKQRLDAVDYGEIVWWSLFPTSCYVRIHFLIGRINSGADGVRLLGRRVNWLLICLGGTTLTFCTQLAAGTVNRGASVFDEWIVIKELTGQLVGINVIMLLVMGAVVAAGAFIGWAFAEP